MSSVYQGVSDVTRKSYISTAPLSAGGVNHVYAYTKTYNSATYEWSGSLGTGIDFTAGNYAQYNVAGTVFRETGKRLYPNANPGVDRFMVGVFILDQSADDAGTLGQMFIDPNCSVFAQFNGQRPTYIPVAEDDATGTGLDLGNPVYTRGDITTTEGDVLVSAGDITATAGNITATAGNITATAGSVTAGTSVSVGTRLTVTQDLRFTDTRIVGNVSLNGAGTAIVTSAAVTTSSRIFLSYIDTGAPATPLAPAYVSAQAAGSFTITGTASASVNWLVIN